MALALIVDKIDTVPEAQRVLYVEKEGKHYLDVSGIEDHPETAGLRTAVKNERAATAALKAEVAGWKKLGKTPDEIAELTAAAEAAALDAQKKAGNFDTILQQHKDKAAKERADSEAKLSAERDTAIGIARKAVVDTRIGAALTAGKATGEGLALLPRILADRIKLEFVEGKEQISILAADGTAMIGSGPGGVALFEDLVKETTKTYPSLFQATGAGGGGARPSGAGGAKVMDRKEFEKLHPADQAAKMKAGFTLAD